MCGRYASFLPADRLHRLFRTVNPTPNLQPTWNMAPTRDAPVVRLHPETKQRHLDLLRWGFVAHFTRDLAAARKPINARAETAATSALFRGALAARRCLIPADAFYEWRTTGPGKRPYAIARRDAAPLAFAGLWEGWRAPDGTTLRSFAILTTEANPTLAVLHARMPVILEPPDWPVWLGEVPGEPALLMRPAAAEVLEFWPVGPRVNNARNDGPDLLARLGE